MSKKIVGIYKITENAPRKPLALAMGMKWRKKVVDKIWLISYYSFKELI